MPIGNSDFGADFARGAAIGNMLVQQRERAIELRSKAAMDAIQERHLAAQADMLSQHAALYKQQALKEQDDALTEKAVLAAAQDHHDYLVNEMGLSEAEAAPEVINAVARVAPKVGDAMAQSFERVQRGQKAMRDENFQPFVQQLQTPDGKKLMVVHTSPNQVHLMPNASEGAQVADEIRDKNGNLVSYVTQGANGPRFFPAKTPTPSIATKENIKSIYGQINRLQERYDGLKDKTLFGKPNQEKVELGKRIEALKGEASKLDVAGASTPPPPAASTSRVKVKDKTGKLYTVPASQLDEALQQGYEKAEE